MTHDLQRSEATFLDFQGSGAAAAVRASAFDALTRIESPGLHAPQGPAPLPAQRQLEEIHE